MDVECPYCGEGQDICHDDGYGYEEGRTFEQECGDCGKTFAFSTSIRFYHEAWQADCLNGGEHEMRPVIHAPRVFPDWVRCKVCEHEVRGAYQGDAK